MSCKFDRIVSKTVGGEKLEYGFIFGSQKIVFIKVGAGEDIRKCQDHFQRYIEIAEQAHKRHGFTVICASNPDVPHENMDEKAIRYAASKQGFEDFKLYLWGTSDGAYQNLKLAKRFPETVKWIGVNSSFITFADFEEKLEALPCVKKFLIYGTEDDEFDSVFPALRDKQSDNLKTILIGGADHRFTGLPLPFMDSIDFVEDDNIGENAAGFC